MSEVKRYRFVSSNGYAAIPVVDSVKAERYVEEQDFDRVTAERDALAQNLRFAEEGYQSFADECDALQQRLTAADERELVLDTALRKIKARLDAYAEADMRMPESSVEVCQMIADAALKPAEGRGYHAKHYECIGKGGDYTIVAIAQGAGTLKGFNHYVYKNADGVHFVRDPEDFLSRMQIKP